MMQSNEKQITGYPSIDKPWLKYYSEEARNAVMPERTLYQYIYESNKDCKQNIAIVSYACGRSLYETSGS